MWCARPAPANLVPTRPPTNEETTMSDDLIEVTQEARLSREAAAERLRQLADQLSRHNQVAFEREGMRYSVAVPAEVTLSVEIEVGEENEIEIEINW
jgi:amphi-Trp domain-containing protein